MSLWSRREFFLTSLAGSAAAGLLSSCAPRHTHRSAGGIARGVAAFQIEDRARYSWIPNPQVLKFKVLLSFNFLRPTV